MYLPSPSVKSAIFPRSPSSSSGEWYSEAKICVRESFLLRCCCSQTLSVNRARKYMYVYVYTNLYLFLYHLSSYPSTVWYCQLWIHTDSFNSNPSSLYLPHLTVKNLALIILNILGYCLTLCMEPIPQPHWGAAVLFETSCAQAATTALLGPVH